VIVCHCEVVTDRDVTCAIDGGAQNIAQLCAATGAGRGCGGCVFTLKRLLCQHVPTNGEPALEVERAAS
jgi:NAD(P)H-nitrite reductase large subunit